MRPLSEKLAAETFPQLPACFQILSALVYAKPFSFYIIEIVHFTSCEPLYSCLVMNSSPVHIFDR